LRREVNDFLFRNVVLVNDGVLVGGPRILEGRTRLEMVVIVVVVMRMAMAANIH
jgi:hypothetical protein